MKKLLGIVVLGLLLSENAYSKVFTWTCLGTKTKDFQKVYEINDVRKTVKHLTSYDFNTKMKYDLYQKFVELARADAISELDLRVFELDLLDVLGYGINFDTDTKENSEFKDAIIYSYIPEKGFHNAGDANGYSAMEISAIKNRTLEGIDKLKLKSLLQVAISSCLDGRELSSREYFKKIRI